MVEGVLINTYLVQDN